MTRSVRQQASRLSAAARSGFSRLVRSAEEGAGVLVSGFRDGFLPPRSDGSGTPVWLGVARGRVESAIADTGAGERVVAVWRREVELALIPAAVALVFAVLCLVGSPVLLWLLLGLVLFAVVYGSAAEWPRGRYATAALASLGAVVLVGLFFGGPALRVVAPLVLVGCGVYAVLSWLFNVLVATPTRVWRFHGVLLSQSPALGLGRVQIANVRRGIWARLTRGGTLVLDASADDPLHNHFGPVRRPDKARARLLRLQTAGPGEFAQDAADEGGAAGGDDGADAPSTESA